MKVFKHHKYKPLMGRAIAAAAYLSHPTIRTCERCGVQTRVWNGTRQWRMKSRFGAAPWQEQNITCAVLEGPKQQPKTPTIEDRIARLEADMSQLRNEVLALGGPWRSP